MADLAESTPPRRRQIFSKLVIHLNSGCSPCSSVDLKTIFDPTRAGNGISVAHKTVSRLISADEKVYSIGCHIDLHLKNTFQSPVTLTVDTLHSKLDEGRTAYP